MIYLSVISSQSVSSAVEVIPTFSYKLPPKYYNNNIKIEDITIIYTVLNLNLGKL